MLCVAITCLPLGSGFARSGLRSPSSFPFGSSTVKSGIRKRPPYTIVGGDRNCRGRSKVFMALQSVGIVGAGAWGTALGVSARRAGRDVLLGARARDRRRHQREASQRAFLPGIKLEPRRSRRPRGSTRLPIATCLLMVTPAQHCARHRRRARPLCEHGQPLVLCSKGIEQTTGKLMSQVVAEVLPGGGDRRAVGPELCLGDRQGAPRGGHARDGGGVAGRERSRMR